MTCPYCTHTRKCAVHRHATMNQVETHTAQQLHAWAKDNPVTQRRLARTYETLDKHYAAGTYDSARAFSLVQSNVKSAAQLYVQYHGLDMAWWRVFPKHERYGCAWLWLRRYLDGSN